AELLQPEDDYSNQFSTVSSRLTSSAGVSYRDFRRNLTPFFGVVWTHIFLGYLALVLVGVFAVLVEGQSWGLKLPVLAAVAVLFGYFILYLSHFMHEAAHYNLAPHRRWNDHLANAFIGVLTATDIRPYRQVHFDHHRHLGDINDSEANYFFALNC